MKDYLSQSFDFGVRIVQLSRWLKDEGKEFPLAGRLLECGTSIGISLKAAKTLESKDSYVQAIRQAEEVEYLLELMVKTGFLAELQSKPLLEECGSLKKEIGKLLAHPADAPTRKGKSAKKSDRPGS